MRKLIAIIVVGLIAFLPADAQVCPGTPGELEWHAWQGLYGGDMGQLTANPKFPRSPDVVKPLFRLKSLNNYDDNYGSRVEGFIQVPSNTTVQFNVTGDRIVDFYLSSDENPDNKVLVANVPSQVAELEHYEFPEQTSASIDLVAGQHYYFEILLVVSSTEWNVLTAAYLVGVDCKEEPCPEAGTPCNDGDSSTSDDVEDGACNCFGKPIDSNVCAGEKGQLTAYIYDGIPGGNLNDLYESSNFPGLPSTSEEYDLLGRRSTNELESPGIAVQAYLSVPVSGLYKFNVTGDDQVILFISSDENPENKQAHQVLVSGWSNMTEHDKYIYQSTSNIYLEKGRFYYVEVNHKDGGGNEHFGAFWQTPFTQEGVWKRIDAQYFFDYECELACIPAGTLCDDGDPFTNDDAYNASCECVGIPCIGPDCDSPLANYIPKEKCAPSSSLDNKSRSSWVSCERTANPNSTRGEGHWIMYDLGDRHELHQSQVWNYNKAGEVGKGMSSVAIDYSLDGSTWSEFGTYNWALAPGTGNYGGFNGPNFQGLYARYILISSLDAGSSCKGLGKLAFSAVKCPLAGTPCDDGDELTLGDSYNQDCECTGSAFDVNDCGEMQVLLGDTTLNTSKFSATETVESLSDIARDSRVSFVGGRSITLEPGFETTDRTYFIASIEPCETPTARALIKTRAQQIAAEREQREKDKIAVLTVRKEDKELVEVSYFIEEPGQANGGIYDLSGNKIFTLIDHKFTNQGLYKKRFLTKKLGKGKLVVKLTTKEEVFHKEVPSYVDSK